MKRSKTSEEDSSSGYKKYKQSIDSGNSDDDDFYQEILDVIRKSLAADEKLNLKFDGENIFYNRLQPEDRKKSKSKRLVTIKELLDVDNLESAALSSFCVNYDFIFSLIPMLTKNIPVTLIEHWKQGPGEDGEEQGRKTMRIGKSSMCVCHPYLLPSHSIVHAKLMLLEFPRFLRVVISSANLTPSDWQDYTQCIWVQDFPKLKNDQMFQGNAFQKDLCKFWSRLTCELPHEWLMRYDFSDAKVDLVPSVPGCHKGSAKSQYGHMCLRSLVRNNITSQQAQVLKNNDLYIQTSSVGALYTRWLSEFTKSCNVDYVPSPSSSTRKNQIKIVFPTVDTAKNSKVNGVICLRSSAYSGKEFPTHAFCDYQSNLKSQGCNLAHSKIIVHKSEVDGTSDGSTGWVYVGSHNFSMSAWGRLQKHETQLQISNYELGVLFKNLPPGFKLPFKTPAKSYKENEKPFIYDEGFQDFYEQLSSTKE
ncbi:TDP1 [Acrasis kona]|uniref:TDP1 n=1 Tax=Acrasis kona TaxID=1008807 RepID=A0AAW2Z8F2_9EUKA